MVQRPTHLAVHDQHPAAVPHGHVGGGPWQPQDGVPRGQVADGGFGQLRNVRLPPRALRSSTGVGRVVCSSGSSTGMGRCEYARSTACAAKGRRGAGLKGGRGDATSACAWPGSRETLAGGKEEGASQAGPCSSSPLLSSTHLGVPMCDDVFERVVGRQDWAAQDNTAARQGGRQGGARTRGRGAHAPADACHCLLCAGKPGRQSVWEFHACLRLRGPRFC